MESNFEVVVHHGGVFNEFLHTGYEGLEITWLCDPDRWSYVEVLGNLKVLGYTEIDTIWYYDPYLAPVMHLLDNDNDTSRVRFIAESDGQAHIYVVHPISQPEIVEYLEFNIGGDEGVSPNDAEGVNVEGAEGVNDEGINAKGNVENVQSENAGPTVAEVDSGKEGTTEVELDNGKSGSTEVELEIDNAGANGVDVENEKVGPTEQVEGESVQTGTIEKVSKDKGVQNDGEDECIQLHEDSDDSALGVAFGGSDDELLLNDHFDDGDIGDEGGGVNEDANALNIEGEGVETSSADENVAEAPRKKRGRPKKVHVPKGPRKKRGRTRKVHVAPEVSEPVIEEHNEEEEADVEEDNLQTEGHGESSMAADKGLSDDEVYDSDELDSGSDSDDGGATKSKFPTFTLPSNMKDYKFEVGTYFATKHEFLNAIRTYAIHSGRQLKFKKNDKVRVRVCCKPTCPWNACCAAIPNQETWQLRKIYKGKHKCSRDQRINMMNSKWLGVKLQPSVRENPSMKVTDILNKTQLKWQTGVTKTKAIRSRAMALDAVDGSFREQYTRLHDYGHELLRSNPISTISITSVPYQGTKADLEHPNTIMCPHFQRMYICLNACKESFFKCRQIIGLDGCFLKGYYGGQLLTAIGTDPNDQMLPIAYAVVEGETKESWAWFLDLLVKDLGGRRLCNTYTFISDQQKEIMFTFKFDFALF